MLKVFFLSVASLAFASAVQLRDGVVTRKLLSDEWQVEDLLPWKEIQEAEMARGISEADYYEANLTEYAMRLIKNVGPFLIKEGFDTIPLANESVSYIVGSIELTNGSLTDLSTITISSSVIAKYTPSSDILELTVPLSFDELLATYEYTASLTLLSISGGIDATISNVKLELHMGFNFSNYHVFVDKADVTSTGSISINFTGEVLIDTIVNLLTSVLTILFHEIIIDVINTMIDTPVELIVADINNAIDAILNSNGTTNMTLWN